MTAAVAERVLPGLTCDGFGFDCEFLAACRRLGVPVAEVPVCVRYEDAASTTGLRAVLGMLRELWRARRVAGPVAREVLGPFAHPAAAAEPARSRAA
jgi:hypothetical protein